MDYQCTKKDELKYMKNGIDKNCEDIKEIKKDVATLMINDRGIEEVIKKLEENLEKIVNSIDKAKWWILTGMLGPIILAFVLSKLKF